MQLDNMNDLRAQKEKLRNDFLTGKITIARKIARDFATRLGDKGFRAQLKFSHAEDFNRGREKHEDRHPEDEGEVRILIAPDATQRFGAGAASQAAGGAASQAAAAAEAVIMQDVATLSGAKSPSPRCTSSPPSPSSPACRCAPSTSSTSSRMRRTGNSRSRRSSTRPKTQTRTAAGRR